MKPWPYCFVVHFSCKDTRIWIHIKKHISQYLSFQEYSRVVDTCRFCFTVCQIWLLNMNIKSTNRRKQPFVDDLCFRYWWIIPGWLYQSLHKFHLTCGYRLWNISLISWSYFTVRDLIDMNESNFLIHFPHLSRRLQSMYVMQLTAHVCRLTAWQE